MLKGDKLMILNVYMPPKRPHGDEKDEFGPRPPRPQDAMRTDIIENGNEYIYEIELAGFERDEITIYIQKQHLKVEAKKKEHKFVRYVAKERFGDSCSRSWYVGDVDPAGIKANFHNGLLTISIAKANPEHQSDIDIL